MWNSVAPLSALCAGASSYWTNPTSASTHRRATPCNGFDDDTADCPAGLQPSSSSGCHAHQADQRRRSVA